MVIFFSPELDDEESQATGDGQLTARMLCSVDNNFNLTRYNSIKVVGHDKGHQMLTVQNSSVPNSSLRFGHPNEN